MARSNRFKWKRTPRQAWSSSQWIKATLLVIEMILTNWAPQIEADAKINAQWINRTGNARQRLHAFVDKDTNKIYLVLRHGVTYGKYLELGYGGRYAIILPTLEMYYNQIWRDIKSRYK